MFTGKYPTSSLEMKQDLKFPTKDNAPGSVLLKILQKNVPYLLYLKRGLVLPSRLNNDYHVLKKTFVVLNKSYNCLSHVILTRDSRLQIIMSGNVIFSGSDYQFICEKNLWSHPIRKVQAASGRYLFQGCDVALYIVM